MLVNSLITVAAVLATGVAATTHHMEKRTFWGSNSGSQKFGLSCSGGWIASFGGGCCVSSQTTTTVPSSKNCPKNWSWHTRQNCCVPKQETQNCDCGEGFAWSSNSWLCNKPQTNKCSGGKWYHQRSGECCDDYTHRPPPKNECPTGIRCPTDWYWNGYKCKPRCPTTPAPDCSDWDHGKQCCGGPKPSGGVSHGDKDHGHGGWGGNGNGGWGGKGHGGKGGWGGKGGYGGGKHWKREQSLLSGNDLPHSNYCPTAGHLACWTSNERTGYECIDPATELESCGGCVNGGTGVDCTAISGAKAVGCEAGECKVYSCSAGYKLVDGACELA